MAKKVSVMPEYRGAAMDGLQVTSDLFEGLKFGRRLLRPRYQPYLTFLISGIV